MTFSFFVKFSFMESIESKCFSRSGNLNLGNKKKSHDAMSDKYNAWYLLHVWSKSRVQETMCATAHYHDAKSTHCPSKTLVKMWWTESDAKGWSNLSFIYTMICKHNFLHFIDVFVQNAANFLQLHIFNSDSTVAF